MDLFVVTKPLEKARSKSEIETAMLYIGGAISNCPLANFDTPKLSPLGK